MAKKVLVVVDVQNDFVKGGALAYKYPRYSNTSNVISYVNRQLENLTHVVATRDTHFVDTYPTSLEGRMLPVAHCINETYGWEIVDGITKSKFSRRLKVFDKPTFGTLIVADYIRELMRHEDIEEIEMVGYCLSICVLANAVILRSQFPNVKITVLKKLCGDIDEDSFNAAIQVLRNQQIEVI